MLLNLVSFFFTYLESNAVIIHTFWRPQPTLPCLGLQYSISRNLTRTVVSLSSMQGVFAESLLRKQTWRNRKKGRVGCLHQNIFTRKVTEIAFIAINIHIPRPPRPCIWRPASLSHTSTRPIIDVPKSLVSHPRVTSPHSSVPLSPSQFYTQPKGSHLYVSAN